MVDYQVTDASDGVVVDDIRDAVSALKRERIITMAVECFYVSGYSNTTLEAVAERMNVTKPFIYSHFRSKGDLLAEICARGIRTSLNALNRIVDSEGSPGEKLAALGRDFMVAVLQNQKHIAIYTREEKNLRPDERETINEMRREFDRKLISLLDAGVASGEFVIEDTRMAALAIGGMTSWSYVWYRPNGPLAIEEVAERMTRLVLRMIQAKPATKTATRRKSVARKQSSTSTKAQA